MSSASLVNVSYKIKLTPAEHTEFMMRCDFESGNDIINDGLSDSITDWYPLEDEPFIMVYIDRPKNNNHRIADILRSFMNAVDEMLSTCIYPQYEEFWAP